MWQHLATMVFLVLVAAFSWWAYQESLKKKD